ncbi:MAG TPA: hypothetical protein VLA48_03005 [Nitrososphaeraceae archaeon]|nr:hypothetical protein [Nitrososphaeraceae archaeon]
MEREFVSYDEALALKELGFNELCFGYFHYIYKKDLIVYPIKGCVNSALLEKEVSAPLYRQAFRWFREKYGLKSEIVLAFTHVKKHTYAYEIYNGFVPKNGKYLDSEQDIQNTYEKAELECLKKLIEIAKKDDN